MPARGENEDAAFVARDFQHGGIAGVEFGDDFGIGESRGVEAAVAPEVDLGEVAETRLGEGGEEQMAKVYGAKHGVGRGLHSFQFQVSGCGDGSH